MRQRKALAITGGIGGLLVVALLAVAAVVIFNRGSGGSGGSGGSAAQGTSQPGGPRQAGELRLPGNDPLTLDPALVTDVDSATYVVELFGGLVSLDKNLSVVPDIARDWSVSPDGKTYTFHLRDDVAFSNSGRKVTAADFKYSIERAADPATDSPTADTYLGDIVGAKDMIRGKAKDISGVKVIDDTTLQITIDEAKPYFLAKLTYPTAFVVDKNQIASDKRNWTKHPNGTGPFKLQEWKIGESVVLVPNELYHGDPKPQMSRVVFNLAGGSVLTQYQNGEIDVAGVGVNDIDAIRSGSDQLSKEFIQKPELSTDYIAFNTQQPPFDDARVRQAFAMAIDKQQMANVILKNLIPATNSILPPGIPGYTDQQGLGFDPAKAKQLLQDSKYAGKLPRIVMTTSGTGQNLGPTTEAMIEMWKQNLGVEVEVEQVETATFFEDLHQGKYQMWEAGWSADYPDPQNFLDLHFASDSVQNETKYSNPQVDALLKQARTTQDTAARMKLYQQVESQVLQDAAWVPLFHGEASVVVKPYIKGWEPTGIVIPILKYVTVDKT